VSIETRKPHAPGVLTIKIDEQLIRTLERLKGRHSYNDLAEQTGVREGMLRAFMTRRSDAGLDTLSALVAWELLSNGKDVDRLLLQMPEITRLVMIKLIQRGDYLARRNRFEVVAA